MKKVYKAPLTRAIMLSPKACVAQMTTTSEPAGPQDSLVKEESAWSDDDSDWDW